VWTRCHSSIVPYLIDNASKNTNQKMQQKHEKAMTSFGKKILILEETLTLRLD